MSERYNKTPSATQEAGYAIAPATEGMDILRQGLGLPITQAGRFEGRDHSTVCYTLQRLKVRMDADPELAQTVQALIKACLS